MISHRTDAMDTAPSRAQRLAQTGDVFFETVRPYQRNNYLFVKPDTIYVFYWICAAEIEDRCAVSYVFSADR